MKRLAKFLPVMALMLFLASCSSVQVAYDYDKKVDFDNYKSYAYLKEGIDKLKMNDLDKKRILNAIDQSLEGQGYNKVSTDPSFVINIYTKAEKQYDVTSTNYYGGGFGYYGWGWGPYWGPSSTYVTTNIEGTLYIDILDTKTKTLVWQGVGSGYVDKDASSEQKDIRVQQFVQKILAQFPPNQIKKKK